MPQIMPAEIFDAGTFQGFSPSQRVGMPKRFPGIGKHPLAMFAKLPSQHLQRRGIQRYSDWLAVLGLTCADPGMPRAKSTCDHSNPSTLDCRNPVANANTPERGESYKGRRGHHSRCVQCFCCWPRLHQLLASMVLPVGSRSIELSPDPRLRGARIARAMKGRRLRNRQRDESHCAVVRCDAPTSRVASWRTLGHASALPFGAQ